jgi:hypothetical protein
MVHMKLEKFIVQNCALKYTFNNNYTSNSCHAVGLYALTTIPNLDFTLWLS